MLAVMSNIAATPMVCHEPLTPRFCLRDAAKQFAVSSARRDAYDWHSWPHSPQQELEIACERLKKAQKEVSTGTATQLQQELDEKIAWALNLKRQVDEWTAWGAELEKQMRERTAWALQLESQLEERTAAVQHFKKEFEDVNRQMEERTSWALRLQREVEDLKKHALNLSNDLERLAWARPIDRRLHDSLQIVHRLARAARDRINRILSREPIDTQGRT